MSIVAGVCRFISSPLTHGDHRRIVARSMFMLLLLALLGPAISVSAGRPSPTVGGAGGDSLATLDVNPVFTGNVATDFTDPTHIVVTDPGAVDVGMPVQFPLGTISGWDMDDLRLAYDPAADTLYVGFNTYNIAGDADASGNPSVTGPILMGLSGTDVANLGGTESFALLLDVDEDGTFDAIAGVPDGADTTGFRVSRFSGTPFAPSISFGTLLAGNTGALFASPSAAQPDLEFTILNYSTLPKSSGSDPTPYRLKFNAFMGSFSDAGIGEDFLPGVNQTIEVPIAPSISIAKTPDLQVVPRGTTVTFNILVTNTGNVALSGVTVTDPQAPSCDRVIGNLAVGASSSYSCTLVVQGDLVNVASVVGTPPAGPPVQDSDDAAVDVHEDYGDAPAGYGTLFAALGPRHFLAVGGPFLGAVAPDEEADGQPSAAANGDDLNTSDDEDGVSGPTLEAGKSAALNLQTSGAGRLDAWIDFDRDGSFEPSEQVATNLLLAGGASVLNVSVPVGAVGGTTFGRFRYSSAGGLGPTGPAANGEVEDHVFTIAAATATPTATNTPTHTPTNTPTPTATPTNTPLPGLCLGNRVFLDLDNDGVFEPVAGEFTLDGVVLTLYRDSDSSGDLTPADVQLAQTLSTRGGRYAFCDLAPGDYIVALNEANFSGGTLEGLVTSTGNDILGQAPDPDNDIDQDDNGQAQPSGAVASKAITLTVSGEPDTAADGDDRNGNLTLDFGVRRPDPPTLARLLDWDARADEAGKVLLTWRMADESDVLGFHVDRGTADGAWQRLTAAPIAAGGNGRMYRLADQLPTRGDFQYRLTILGTDSRQTPLGTLSVAWRRTAAPLSLPWLGRR